MDPASLPELWELLESPDRKVREKTAHQIEAISAVRPDLVQPCKDLVLRFMPRINDWIVRSRYCLIIPRLQLSAEEQQEAFEMIRSFLKDRSSIVRTFAMQAMFDLGKQNEEFLDDVREVVDHAAAKGTKAMRARARHLLQQLAAKPAHPRPPRQSDARRKNRARQCDGDAERELS